MMDQRSYFEKADFQSNLPHQVLIGVVGLFLVFLEVGFAQLPVFFGASPLLSVILIYCMRVFHMKFMPIGTVFLIGIVADLLLSDIVGGRTTVLMLMSYVIEARKSRLEQSEFGQIWFDFLLCAAATLIFQLFFFSILNLAIPSLNPILFQLGVTTLLFPFGFLLIYSIHRLMQELSLIS
jgi:rod shape-determining protein MreD